MSNQKLKELLAAVHEELDSADVDTETRAMLKSLDADIHGVLEQNGEGAINCISHGHGTDGSKIACYFEYGHGEITMVNTELVAMSSQNKTAILISEGFDS